MFHRLNTFTVIVTLFALATINRVNADWFHDFNNGPQLPDSFEVFVPPGIPRSFTISHEVSSGYLTMTDSLLPHVGAVVLVGVDMSEMFSDVRVSGTVNVGPSLDNRLSLAARHGGHDSSQAYAFGVSFAPGPDMGTAWFVRVDPFPNLLELNSKRDFGIPTMLDIDTSYYLEFDVIGDQLTGRIFDAPDGNELLSMSYTDPRPLGPGYAGVVASHELDHIPVGGTFDDVSAIAIRPGDFDIDGDINAVDIDLLSLEVRGGSNDATFDLTGDGLVNQEDRNAWVENVSGTFFGDADLNKTVEFADFLSLANGFDMPGGWANGDFDGNGTVLFPDFLLLSSNFGKSATAVAAVPEPNAAMLLLVGLVSLVRRRWITHSVVRRNSPRRSRFTRPLIERMEDRTLLV